MPKSCLHGKTCQLSHAMFVEHSGTLLRKMDDPHVVFILALILSNLPHPKQTTLLLLGVPPAKPVSASSTGRASKAGA